MKDEDSEDGGILIRVFSNSDIQKGFGLFAIALILAFASVMTTTETDVKGPEEIVPEDHGFKRINYPTYTVRNATLELDFDPDDEPTGAVKAEIKILNGSYDSIWRTNWYENDSLTLDMMEVDGNPVFLSFNVTNGNLTYTYTVTYSASPYGILSLPAALLTMIGMIYAFKGKGVILGEIKRKRMEREAKKKKEERGSDTSEEEEQMSKKVIYGGGKEGSKESDADHIDFMGISKESDEDEEG